MSVRTRIAVDIVTEEPITDREMEKILNNAKGLVNHLATADTEEVKPLMIDKIWATGHAHNGYDDMCSFCVKKLAQDGIK